MQKALRSILEQDSNTPHEIILVDNGSTDDTRQVVFKSADEGKVRYVFEPQLGLCVARNTGWQTARGQIVAFFDDDAIASPGWLEAIRSSFATNPNIGVLGGPVRPIWEMSKPAWLADELACSLTVIDWGEEHKRIPDIRAEWLAGANMAIPKKLLEAVGGFHPWLDRVGKNLLSSGDVFLQKKIIEIGHDCYYDPKMIISHFAPRSRLNQSWFKRRYYWQGVSDAVMDLIERRPSFLSRLSLAANRLSSILRPSVLVILFRHTDEPAAFARKCFALIDVGYVAGMLGAARR